MQAPNFKALEFGDVTHEGTDLAGCTVAVGLGTATAAAVGTLSADKLSYATRRSRAVVGLAVGRLFERSFQSCLICG